MKIWAHRGCSYAWPENTLQAFEAACRYPITGIELDIQLTKDQEVVVIHDEKVDRTTDGIGYVKDFALKELKELKIISHPSGTENQYVQIPTMEEVFDILSPYCRDNGLLINIELKNSVVRYEGMEDKILDMVRKWKLEDYVVFSSFNPESVHMIKEKNPAVKTGILAASVRACLDFARQYPVDALHPYINGLDVEDLKDRTILPVRAWNIRKFEPFYPDRGEVEMQNLDELEKIGVTDIFTNVPEKYLQETKGKSEVSV